MTAFPPIAVVRGRHLGALLRGYYTDDGKLFYADRAGTGMSDKVLADLRRRLEPLVRTMMPLSAPPPGPTRFRSPLAVSRVHWVERRSAIRSNRSRFSCRPERSNRF